MKKLIALAVAALAIATVSAVAIPAVAAPERSATAAATKTVRVADNEFRPGSLTVKRRTKVRWRWVGSAPHDVVVRRGPVRFRSKVQRSGTYTRTMKRRGTYRIVCSIHSGMRMRLRVR